MFEKVKNSISKGMSLPYEKVYIIGFKNSDTIPSLSREDFASLGKWYVNTGKEWICHSELSIFEFQQQFLQLSHVAASKVDFGVDYMPFSK